MTQISFPNQRVRARLDKFRGGTLQTPSASLPSEPIRHAAPNTTPRSVRLALALHDVQIPLAPHLIGAIMSTLKVFECRQPCSDSACSTRSLTIPLAKPPYAVETRTHVRTSGEVDRTTSGLEVSRPASHRACIKSPSRTTPAAPRCERTCTSKPYVGSIPDPTSEADTLTEDRSSSASVSPPYPDRRRGSRRLQDSSEVTCETSTRN